MSKFTDRDAALSHALKQSRAKLQIHVVFQGLPNEWHVYTYGEWHYHTPFHDMTTRYVLPNGEVTKLS